MFQILGRSIDNHFEMVSIIKIQLVGSASQYPNLLQQIPTQLEIL
jgi:hypothetical protein